MSLTRLEDKTLKLRPRSFRLHKTRTLIQHIKEGRRETLLDGCRLVCICLPFINSSEKWLQNHTNEAIKIKKNGKKKGKRERENTSDELAWSCNYILTL